MNKSSFKPILSYSPSVEYSAEEEYLVRQILEARTEASESDVLDLKKEHQINDRVKVLVWQKYYLIEDAEMSVFEKKELKNKILKF